MPGQLEDQLVGLAFSGGGIRSATFNLGILQALAERGVLRCFDYLSTVSGGGYISAWLAAWVKHDDGIISVQRRLDPAHAPMPAGFPEPGPVDWLRQYSNYLTPHAGLLAADTWTMAAIYLRNLILNLLILILALGAVLMVPRLAVGGLRWLAASPDRVLYSFSFAVLVWLWAVTLMAWNMASLTGILATRERPPWSARPLSIHLGIILTVVFSAAFLVAALWSYEAIDRDLEQFHWYRWGAYGAIASTGVWFWAGFSWLVAKLFSAVEAVVERNHQVPESEGEPVVEPEPEVPASNRRHPFSLLRHPGELWPEEARKKARKKAGEAWRSFRAEMREKWRWGPVLLAAPAAGLAGGVMLFALAGIFRSFKTAAGDAGLWRVSVWGPPLVLVAFCLTGVIHIGLCGDQMRDRHREWWSRAGAWTMFYASIWLLLFAAALYGPYAVELLSSGAWTADRLKNWSEWLTRLSRLGLAGAVAGWLISSIRGVMKARQAAAERELLSLATQATPYIFVVGLLLLLSLAVDHVLYWWASALTDSSNVSCCALAFLPPEEHWSRLDHVSLPVVALAFLACLTLAIVSALRVDVNDFSMHLFYRNRLARCYLGASNPERNPNLFTDLDPNDDLYLAEFITNPQPSEHDDEPEPYVGPYPIFNATLNLQGGGGQATQARPGISFVMTPRYCGYVGFEEDSRAGIFRETAHYAGREGGPYLSTAVAISGAAATPGMGGRTTPAINFLMTVFNVRMGWWLGNPRYRSASAKPGPEFGLINLFYELLSLGDDQSRFVYLSDGGHFENLGVYELVRRRCRLIVACDAGHDRDCQCEDLLSLMEKCRLDLGVEIEFDPKELDALRKADSGFNGAHFAMGRIRYKRTGPPGLLIYIKPTLTGDEPATLLRYCCRADGFPQQPTTDQWFDESQFENYRLLGYHIGSGLGNGVAAAIRQVTKWEPEPA